MSMIPGGTHLPDVTLVSRTVLGYAVSRAHHADVGGMEPASLPAFSRELYQEGLILPPVPPGATRGLRAAADMAGIGWVA